MLETIVKSVIGITGGVLSFLLGEWTPLLTALCVFVVIDFLSGLLAGSKNEGLNSSKGFKGIPRKVLIFLMVAIGHTVDRLLGMDGHLFRDIVVYFYLANELISIIENTGRAGLPVPPVMTKIIAILKEKGDKTNK